MEQASFERGQELIVLVIDANGNVTATPVIVGAGGVIQYKISMSNCIVRFLKKA